MHNEHQHSASERKGRGGWSSYLHRAGCLQCVLCWAMNLTLSQSACQHSTWGNAQDISHSASCNYLTNKRQSHWVILFDIWLGFNIPDYVSICSESTSHGIFLYWFPVFAPSPTEAETFGCWANMFCAKERQYVIICSYKMDKVRSNLALSWTLEISQYLSPSEIWRLNLILTSLPSSKVSIHE